MTNVEVYNESVDIYNFSINECGYIDFKINNFLVDTIEDLGKMRNETHLKMTVLKLLRSWEVEFKFIIEPKRINN